MSNEEDSFVGCLLCKEHCKTINITPYSRKGRLVLQTCSTSNWSGPVPKVNEPFHCRRYLSKPCISFAKYDQSYSQCWTYIEENDHEAKRQIDNCLFIETTHIEGLGPFAPLMYMCRRSKLATLVIKHMSLPLLFLLRSSAHAPIARLARLPTWNYRRPKPSTLGQNLQIPFVSRELYNLLLWKA